MNKDRGMNNARNKVFFENLQALKIIDIILQNIIKNIEYNANDNIYLFLLIAISVKLIVYNLKGTVNCNKH